MRKIILLTLLMGLSLGLRLYHLDARGLITDEKFTLVTANGFWVGGANQSAFKKAFFTPKDFWEKKGIQDYFDATAHSDFGTHIIHNGVIHYWMKLFGNSDYSLRFPSVLFNVLNIVLLFFLVLRYSGSYWAAFLAGLFLAIDPLNVAQSHIARSYPLSFLLITLSTWLFIRLVQGEGKQKRNFVIYAVLVGASLLNHYINFFIPLSHALLFLVMRNKAHLWKGFIASAIFVVGLMVYWFNWGGGYTAFGFLKDKNKIHTEIAANADDELSQVIQLATPDLVIKKGISLFYDISVVGHGLFDRILGVKVFICSLLVFAGLYWFMQNKKGKWIGLGIALVLLVYQMPYFWGILAAVAIYSMVVFGWQRLREIYSLESLKGEWVLLGMGILMLVLPILFVVRDAFVSHNTTSLTHRYIGNASPFVVMLMAMGSVRMVKENVFNLVFLVILLAIQTPAIINSIKNYYDDRSIYNAYFEPRRVPNPYITAAEKVKQLASPGDTLVIPGAYKDKYQERFNKEMEISYNDAQYLNMYFDKNFEILEYVDRTEREKLYLKKKSGEKLLIFDFKGEEFRY